MSATLRWAGAGMVIGGILFFGRMGPIFAILPEDMAFPPSAPEDLVRLAQLAGARWTLSHSMGLAAVGLFIAGYWAQASALAGAGHNVIGRIAALIATIAFGLFAVALVTDGFILPPNALSYLAGGPDAPILADIENIHEQALQFFTPAIFLMFIAMAVLSSRLLHGFIHSRWLGGLGMLIGIAAPTAYLFGVTGPNWNNLQIGGSLMMLGFLWLLLIGLVSLFGKGVRE